MEEGRRSREQSPKRITILLLAGNDSIRLRELGIIGIKYMIMRTIRDNNDSNNEEENVI